MSRILLIALSLSMAVTSLQPVRAEEKSSETIVIVPMEVLPSYGSLVSAWYKRPVYDTSGKKVGIIADMLFSADGAINAVMIDVGGFFGMGRKHVAVPVSAISVSQKNNRPALTINTTKDAIQNAKGYKYDPKNQIWNPL